MTATYKKLIGQIQETIDIYKNVAVSGLYLLRNIKDTQPISDEMKYRITHMINSVGKLDQFSSLNIGNLFEEKEDKE